MGKEEKEEAVGGRISEDMSSKGGERHWQVKRGETGVKTKKMVMPMPCGPRKLKIERKKNAKEGTDPTHLFHLILAVPRRVKSVREVCVCACVCACIVCGWRRF